MAGEDVLIRVGVDYSAAIASTRQFEQELRRILASSAQSAVASAAATTSAALSASTTNRGALPQQAAGQLSAVPDYTRELTSINKNLEILVQLTRSNTNRTVIFSEGPRTTPVAVSAPPPVVTTSSTPRPVAAPVAPPRPVQVTRPTPVASFANDRAARELATAQTAYANTLRQLATRAVAPVQVAAPAPVSHVAPRALPQPTTRVLDTTPVQTAMASVVAELNKVRQPSQVSGAAIAAQLSAEMTPFRVMMTSLTAAMSSARASVAQLSAASAGAGRVLEVVGARSSGSSFGGSGSPPPPPISPQPSSPPPQPPQSPRGLSSGPTPLGLPSGDWQSPWIGEFDEALKRRVNGWIKQRVAEVGQGPSGAPIATPWVHPTVSWGQPIPGNLGPIRPDLVMPPVRTMLGPGPEVSRPVIDATARQRSQELVLAQRDYATSLRRASDVTNQQAARYVDLKTIQRPIGDQGEANLPVLARQQQLLDRQIAYETAAVRGPSSGQIPLPTQSVTLRDRLALDSGKESRASAEIVLAKDGLAAEYRRVAKQLRAKAELEARSVLPSSGKPIVPSSDRSKIKGIPREVSDWILKNSGPNDDFNADELIEAYHASRAYRKRIRKEADERYGDEVWELQALQRPPAKQRKVRPSGEVYWGRSGGEWDWFDSLSESHQRRLRKSMVPVGSVARGLSPDEASRFSTMAEVSGGNLHDASSDEAMGALIRKIDRADALLSVSRGRTDSEALAHVNLDDLLPDSFDSSGISAYRIMTDPITAMLNVARHFSQLESKNAWEELGRPGGSEGAPWTMSRADWSGQLLDALSAKDYSTVDRLYPPSVFGSLTGPPMGLDDAFDRIRHLAALADMGDIHPSPNAAAVQPDRAPHPLTPPPSSFEEEFGPSQDEQRQLNEMLRAERLRELQGIYSVGREAALLAGGAGGIPPSPPRIGSGFGDEDDDEVRRLKAQLAAALRRRIQALNAETEASKQIADPEIIAANQARRNYQRFVALDEAQEARRAGDDQAYRGLVASVVPKGAERARFMLSNDPFGYGGFEQELLRDIGAQRRALSAPSADFVPRDQQARLDRLALPASTTYGPEYRKPVSYQPQQPTHGPIEIGDEGWRSRERAAHRARNTASSESPPLGLRWRQTSEGVFQGYFGQGKDAEPIPVRYERVREDGKVTGTRVTSSEGERFFPGHQSVAEAKLYAESLESVRKATEDARASTVRAAADERRRTDLLGLGPGRFAEKTSEAAGRRVLPSSGQTYPMPVSSARQLLDHPSPRQSKVDRLLSDDQFRGMPPDVAERFQSTARRVFESLPGLSKYVEAIGTETFPEIPDVWGAGRVPGSSGNGRATRPVFDRDGNVIEGGRIGVNPAISEAEIARAVRSGAKAGAPDVSRVAAHELGHQIDYVGQNAYIQKLFPGSRLGSANYQAGYEQYVDELRGIITKGQPGMSVQDILRRDISGYAADMFDKKPGEAMAEATALMHTGKVNPTAQRIYDWTVRQSGLGPTSDAFGTEQRASGIFDSEIVRDASTKRVSDTEFAAAVDKDISGDPELDNRKTQADADRKSDRHDRTQKTDKELIDRGEEEKISKSQRKKLGAMLPEEEIADFEQRATKFSKAVGRITDQDLKTPEGQGALQALGEHGQRLRAEMEGVIAPEGDGVLAESLYRSRKLVDSGISDVDFASERKETRATAEAREAAEARRATQAEAAAARKRFLNESPAGQMQNLKGYLGALREEMGSLRVNPDITAAKQKFAELSALLSTLEEKAAGIEVDPEDGRAVENYAKLRSGIQQQRANLESIGSQLGQRETFAKYEQDMAAWRQARAGRSAGRKLTDWFTMRSADEPVMPEGYAPTGGGRGGGGGFDGGGPGGLGGADGPNDRRGFSRFLYNARHRGGALGFFETGALSTLRYGLPSMAMFGAMRGISNATREAEEFRFTMEKVRAQLADTFGSGSDQIFEHFKNNILDLSKETGVQADVLASLGMQFQGAFGSETIGGLSGQALVESQLQAAAKLSQVTKIPAAELTDGLTAASFGFNRTNEDISNVALRLESLSGVTAKETIGFIGDIAPVATEAGFSLEELASMAAIAQQKSGRSGAALAESFGRIIPAISNSKDKLLELADADKALQAPEFLKALSGGDIKTTLLFLVKNFQNLTKSSQDFVVTALGGRREAQALLAAVGDQGQLDKYISGAEDSDGTLEARFKSAQSTLTVQMQRLRQEFNLFVASLLESGLADVLSGLVAAVSLLVKGFEAILTISGGINDFFGGLPGKIMGVVAAIVAMRVALGFVGGGIRKAFDIPKEATIHGTIRGTLTNTASGVWAGTRQGGLLGALSGRIGAARAAYAGLPPIGAQMVLPGMEAAGASAAAGAAGASTASSGLGAAVTAFTGVSTTALAAGGLALGALAGTYLMIRHSLDRHSEEAKNIANWARDSKTSVEDIQNLIDSSESDGGPGIWTSIWGGLAGKRYLGVRDQYRAELARKKITSSERKQIEGLSSSSAEDQIDELITDTINVKIPKADKAYRTPNERRDARREVSVAKKRRADLEKEVRKAFSLIDDDGLAERGLGVVDLNDYVSNEASRGANKLLRKFAKLAGVKTGKLEGSVAKALASGKAKEELQKIRDDENSTDNEIRQATAAQLSLSKGDKDIDTDVKLSKSSQTIETITKNYKAGVIGYNTYIQRVKENLETLRNNIAVTGGTDEQRQRQAQLITELSQEISQKAVDATQMQLDNFQTTSGAAPETMAKARVMQYSALIKSGKLSGEQRLEVVKQLFQAQRDLLTKAIENADSGAEVEKIVAEGARIDPETRINAIIGGISKLNGNWVTFTETFRTIFGESAGAYIGSLVRAMDAGTMTNAEVRADLIKRIEVLQQTRKNILRRFAGGELSDAAKAKMQAVDEAINNLFGEIVSIDTTGSFTNDPGSKITPEAEAALQADLKGIQSRSAHDQALARGNSIKKARIGVQAARDVVAATKKYKPDDEAAIRDAETKLLDAEAAERESIRDRSRALVDRAKSFARARHDSVGAAQLDVQAAFLDLKAAQEEFDEAGIARAQGSIAEAVEAERQSRVNKIIQFMELGKALNSKGDTVQDSLIDRDIAQVRLNNATGDDVAQAMIDLKKAEDAIRQALIGRFNSLVELQKLENGDDPLADARIDLSAAQTMLALAQNEDEKINAQKQLLTAEKQIQDAMRDVRNSRYELRQAELTAMGDEVGASMTAAQLARAQLSEALQLANQGKGPGEAEINRLRAAVATADKAASDTAFQDKLDDYSFLYNMGQLTKSEYVNYLEGLKSTLIPGTKQFKDLELQIKQLKDDISGGLQMNLPTSLALPTLYEARRLNQIGESTGGNGTYNDSRTYNVIVNVDSSMSQADLVNALNNAMGNGVVGSDVRLY